VGGHVTCANFVGAAACLGNVEFIHRASRCQATQQYPGAARCLILAQQCCELNFTS